ncbi:hypothetical protein RZS08_46065, partial [Arthrospira platensis SPKY1]|nr:hypothetical protein [Arthrospira platensis SPKY1]
MDGCAASSSVQVSVADELAVAIVGDAAFCAGGSTLLQASSTFEAYEWSDGSTGSSLAVSQPGTYGLTVTAASGCAGEASVEVVENALPTASITGDLAYCAGGSTLLSAPPGLSYAWSDG